MMPKVQRSFQLSRGTLVKFINYVIIYALSQYVYIAYSYEQQLSGLG